MHSNRLLHRSEMLPQGSKIERKTPEKKQRKTGGQSEERERERERERQREEKTAERKEGGEMERQFEREKAVAKKASIQASCLTLTGCHSTWLHRLHQGGSSGRPSITM